MFIKQLYMPSIFSFPQQFDNVGKKAKIRNQYNQISHLTQDTIWESDKNTRKHLIQESQEVSPFPASDHKVAKKSRHDNMMNTHETQKTKMMHKRSTVPE